jgi:hypothetical protein
MFLETPAAGSLFKGSKPNHRALLTWTEENEIGYQLIVGKLGRASLGTVLESLASVGSALVKGVRGTVECNACCETAGTGDGR